MTRSMIYIQIIKNMLVGTVTRTNLFLGRWERTGDKLNKIKSHWANIDHCGTCSNKELPKPDNTKILK